MWESKKLVGKEAIDAEVEKLRLQNEKIRLNNEKQKLKNSESRQETIRWFVYLFFILCAMAIMVGLAFVEKKENNKKENIRNEENINSKTE